MVGTVGRVVVVSLVSILFGFVVGGNEPECCDGGIQVYNLIKDTLSNKFYRHVIYTGEMQLTLMKLNPNEDIPTEVHDDSDQLVIVGQGGVNVEFFGDEAQEGSWLSLGGAVVIPAHTCHRVCAGDQGAKLFVVYSTPQHQCDLVQESKPDEENDSTCNSDNANNPQP